MGGKEVNIRGLIRGGNKSTIEAHNMGMNTLRLGFGQNGPCATVKQGLRQQIHMNKCSNSRWHEVDSP